MLKIVTYIILAGVLLFVQGCLEKTEEAPHNSAPVALPDQFVIQLGEIKTLDVLANDTDSDGVIDRSTLEIVQIPQHGTAVVEPALGTIRYTADETYEGEVTLTYRVKDDDGAYSNEANVLLNSMRPNQVPVAKDDRYHLYIGTISELDILANDTDSDGMIDRSTLEIVQMPQHGTAVVEPVSGTIRYTANETYEGEVTLTYRVKDDDGAYSNEATVDLWLMVPNAAPVAENDSFEVIAGEETVLHVLMNDKDPDGKIDPCTVVVRKSPQHGKVMINHTTGDILYTADETYDGIDRFSYQVKDDQSQLSNTAWVDVHVQYNAPRPLRTERSATRWYMQFRAENLGSGQIFTGAKVGEVATKEEADYQSLVSFGAFGSPYMTIICKDPEGKESTNYTVYFRAFTSGESEKRWRFEVHTDMTNAEIGLYWQGLYVMEPYIDDEGRRRYSVNHALKNPLLSQMKLLDTETGEEVAAVFEGKLQHYRFNMSGKESRVFEWILQDTVVALGSYDVSHMPVPETTQKQHSGFDMNHPPQIKGLSE